MRILALLTDAFGGRGGIAKFNRDLLAALGSHPDCDEIVAIPRVMPDPPVRLPPRVTWRQDALGGKIRYIRCVSRLARASRPRNRQLRGPAVAPPCGFDLILCAHINLLPMACLARWLAGPLPAAGYEARRNGHIRNDRPARAVRPPIVLVLHGVEAWRPTCSRWCDFLLWNVDALISVSEFTRRRFVDWTSLEKKPSLLLPNCIDLAEFRPGPRSAELLARYRLRGRPVLLTLARLCAEERYKGIDEVLALMPALTTELPDLCYVVAGEGNDRLRLMAKARSLGLSVFDVSSGAAFPAQVVFTGHILEREKADLYRLADAFVMPGRGEGFGIVYLEALACGVPVVGSTLDASREVLAGCETAFLVDPTDPNEIWNGICRAFACRRGVVPARVRAFSREAFVARTWRVLDELGMKLGLVESAGQSLVPDAEPLEPVMR